MKRLVLVATAFGTLTLGGMGCASSAASPRAGVPAAPPICPKGAPLPPNQGAAIDYVDMLKYGGRSYVATGTPPAGPLKTGRVVFTVRCAAAVPEDQRRGEVPVVDEGSTFVPVGTPVYEVAGVSTDCELAAAVAGESHVYFARDAVGCPAH